MLYANLLKTTLMGTVTKWNCKNTMKSNLTNRINLIHCQWQFTVAVKEDFEKTILLPYHCRLG